MAEDSDTKTAFDLLTEQITELSRELAVAKNKNSTLESQVRQLSEEKEALNKEISAKSEEVIHLAINYVKHLIRIIRPISFSIGKTTGLIIKY